MGYVYETVVEPKFESNKLRSALYNVAEMSRPKKVI